MNLEFKQVRARECKQVVPWSRFPVRGSRQLHVWGFQSHRYSNLSRFHGFDDLAIRSIKMGLCDDR